MTAVTAVTYASSRAHDAQYKFSLAENYVSLANILAKAHDRVQAIDDYRSALSILQTLAAKDPYNALVARDLADTKRKLRAPNALEQANHDQRRSFPVVSFRLFTKPGVSLSKQATYPSTGPHFPNHRLGAIHERRVFEVALTRPCRLGFSKKKCTGTKIFPYIFFFWH